MESRMEMNLCAECATHCKAVAKPLFALILIIVGMTMLGREWIGNKVNKLEVCNG